MLIYAPSERRCNIDDAPSSQRPGNVELAWIGLRPSKLLPIIAAIVRFPNIRVGTGVEGLAVGCACNRKHASNHRMSDAGSVAVGSGRADVDDLGHGGPLDSEE